MLYAMFRSSKALQYFLNYQTIYLCDGVVMSNILLDGSIIYDEDTEFIWRDRHHAVQNHRASQYLQEATKRYFGSPSKIEYASGVQLILESFKNKACDASSARHKEKIYFKLLGDLCETFSLQPRDFETNRSFLLYWKLRHCFKKIDSFRRKSCRGLKCLLFPKYRKRKKFKRSMEDFGSNELSDKDWWNKRHQRCVEQIQKGDIDLLMIGDSITHFWQYSGAKFWNRYYGHRKAINLGFAGDTVEQVLWRIEHLPLEMIQPKLAILLAGTNNIIQDRGTPKEIAQAILDIVSCLQNSFSKPITIIVLNLLPMDEMPDGERRKKVNEVNSRLGDLLVNANNVILFDISRALLTQNQRINLELMPDLYHLSEEAFGIFGQAIEPVIKKVLG